MMKLILISLVAVLAGLLLVPTGADALPKGSVGYKLYHYEDGSWVGYKQGDPFPPGGADPGTDLWKYEYMVFNHEFPSGVYQFIIFFNEDDIIEGAIYSSCICPEGWDSIYVAPASGHYNWKIIYITMDPMCHVVPGDSLGGYEVEFNWTEPGMLPGPQSYDLICAAGSEPGVTGPLPTPVEAVSWGRIKNLFFK